MNKNLVTVRMRIQVRMKGQIGDNDYSELLMFCSKASIKIGQ